MSFNKNLFARNKVKHTDEELSKFSDEVLDTVSKNVLKYRREKGLSQIQLALEVGLSGGAYIGKAEIRTQNHHFNIRHLSKISKVLDVDICNFFK
jgi:putative transcriptional regulator